MPIEAPGENEYQREPGYAERYRDARFATRSGPRTDAREREALATLLAHPAVERGLWLDMPSGAGRLSELLPGEVVRVDRDPEMLRAAGMGMPRVCASGMALPFCDRSFAGVLCMRLVQHLAEPEQRITLLAELARVSRGPIVVSFFDAQSLQHARRVVGSRLGRRSGRVAVTREAFAAELARAGLEPLATRALLRWVSEQTLLLARQRRA